MKRDYYEVLGVPQTADDKEIKRAYRKVAMGCHPDRNPSPDAEAQFKEASEAYEVLSDGQKRRIYDQAGHDGLRGQGMGGGFSGAGVEDILSSFGDMFGDLFGFSRRGGGGPGGRQRGADLKTGITLSFNEAVFGCSRELKLEQRMPCEGCDGSGGADGSKATRCVTCAGRGQVVHGQGMFLVSSACPDCQGQGAKHQKPCKDCHGAGRRRVSRLFEAKIPAGFDDGMSLRFTGEGESGLMGGPPGDLYVTARVSPHKFLKREGDDLILEMPLRMTEAALGVETEFDGVDGKEKVVVPAGTQPGDIITLKGKGVPRLRGSGRGALHVVCDVEIPKNLTAKQRELLENFAASLASPKKKGFFFSS